MIEVTYPLETIQHIWLNNAGIKNLPDGVTVDVDQQDGTVVVSDDLSELAFKLNPEHYGDVQHGLKDIFGASVRSGRDMLPTVSPSTYDAGFSKDQRLG